MFTGIIEEIGIIQAVQHGPASSLLTIQASKVLDDVKDGDSIAVSGVRPSPKARKMEEKALYAPLTAPLWEIFVREAP